MTEHWDIIVVGARCAGSATAMLLARQGYRVLVVDSAKFPSDTIWVMRWVPNLSSVADVRSRRAWQLTPG